MSATRNFLENSKSAFLVNFSLQQHSKFDISLLRPQSKIGSIKSFVLVPSTKCQSIKSKYQVEFSGNRDKNSRTQCNCVYFAI